MIDEDNNQQNGVKEGDGWATVLALDTPSTLETLLHAKMLRSFRMYRSKRIVGRKRSKSIQKDQQYNAKLSGMENLLKNEESSMKWLQGKFIGYVAADAFTGPRDDCKMSSFFLSKNENR